jgi:hypothetical protein
MESNVESIGVEPLECILPNSVTQSVLPKDDKEMDQEETNVRKETSQEGQQRIGLEFEEVNDNSSELDMQDKPESVDNLEDKSNRTEAEKVNENEEQYGMCHRSDDLSHSLNKEPYQLYTQGEANENEDQTGICHDNDLQKQDESSMESALMIFQTLMLQY